MVINDDLIAEFMGRSIEEKTSPNGNIYYSGIQWTPKGDWHCSSPDLEYTKNRIRWVNDKFKSDFNWLMPVVEKIENIKWNNELQPVNGLTTWGDKPFTVRIEGFTTQILVDNGYETSEQPFTYFTHKHGSKLERTYLAVVEFIEWYNKQTK